VTPVTEIPESVTYATFSDPWGNRIGLLKGDATGAPVSTGDHPTVDWVQLECAEPEKAWDFYRELFGWTITAGTAGAPGGPVHGSIDTGAGSGARGGIGSSRDGKSRVDIYAAVDDLTKYLERAEGLGATTVVPAMKVDEHTEIAMFADPQGTTFGLYAETQ
jgi:predicted enzyme related to lactoylglutathione lyase